MFVWLRRAALRTIATLFVTTTSLMFTPEMAVAEHGDRSFDEAERDQPPNAAGARFVKVISR